MRRYSNKQKVEKSIHIPHELMQFIRRDTYSLLIKGIAGTGKTSLSLTILRALDIKDNFFYICTRVSPKQLFLYYPWLGKFEENQKTPESQETAGKEYSASSFEDARLDEPESLFERITNQLMDVKAPLIIIDSWDAIASFMDREARLNNERVLQTWRERAGAKLIFINEDPKDTSLDFVVDGIVKLRQKLYEDIRIREILLLKLRGVKINKPSYIFTLDNGAFQSCKTYNPAEFVISSNIIIPHKSKLDQKTQSPISQGHYIRTGYRELDVTLGGGFPKKGIVLLELDSNINVGVIMAFLSRIILDFIAADNRIFFCPLEGIDALTAIAYLKSHFSVNSETHTPKIFWLGNEVQGLPDFIVSYHDSENKKKQLEFFHNTILKERQNDPNKLLLNIMSIDLLQKMHTEGSLNEMKLLHFIRQNIDLSIFVVRPYQNLERIPEICNTHLRLIIINGSLFLKSVNPLTLLFAVVIDRSEGYPKIKLVSMV